MKITILIAMLTSQLLYAKRCNHLAGEMQLLCQVSFKMKSRLSKTNKQCRIENNSNTSYFIFDGGGVYSKKNIELELLKKEFTESMSNEKVQSLFKSYKDALFEQKGSGSYTVRFLTNAGFFKEDAHFLYFSHSDFKKAKKCLSLTDLKSRKIKVIAMSWGADTAQRFIKYLRKKGVSVSAFFSVDSTRKGFLYLGALKNILSKKDSRFFRKQLNVSKQYNFYQKTDDGSLSIAKVHGNSIPSADINFNMSKYCLDDTAQIPFTLINHKNILRCPTVLKYFKQFREY